MNKPAFQFYPSDFIMGTSFMTAEEVGIYFRETCNYSIQRQFNKLNGRIGVGRIIKGTAKRMHIPLEVRRKVLSTGECKICLSKENLTVDHIHPYSKGGSNQVDNLQCLCWKCNRLKSDKI